ncbi:MAG: PD40 domain-containing protein [Spirochaetes bacterium]|nr:PD40 domain-containing protein [Spirochaetota bacterium]MBX3724076.1 PD40 domain-containing protein [Turneriella sp.]
MRSAYAFLFCTVLAIALSLTQILTAVSFTIQEPVRIFGEYGKLQTLAVSPDGKSLAFSSDYRDQKGDIVVYNMETKEKTTVTKTSYLESQPVFSRDGKEIYYFINEAGSGSIKKVNLTDGTVSPVTDRNFWCEFPAISPDGRSLTYYSKRENRYNLYELNLANSKETRLTSEQNFDFGPVYSSSGQSIYFYSNRAGSSFSLFRYERGSKQISPLFGPGGFTFQPTTDIQGILIFAVSNVSGNNDIYAVSLGKNRVDQVTNSPGNDLFPVVDIKASRLYYISQREGDYAIYKRQFTAGS